MSSSKKNRFDNSYIWLSYSDLMAGMFLCFLLVFFSINDKQKKDSQEAFEVKKKLEQISMTQLTIEDELFNIVEKLKKDPSCENVNFRIKSLTIEATAKNQSNFWFNSGKSELLIGGKECVKKITHSWAKPLFKNKQYKQIISQLSVDGHTNTDKISIKSEYYSSDDFISNMRLSQARATRAVEEILINSKGDRGLYKWLQENLTANGRSYSQPIFNNGREDKLKSIRVEFSISLKKSLVAKVSE